MLVPVDRMQTHPADHTPTTTLHAPGPRMICVSVQEPTKSDLYKKPSAHYLVRGCCLTDSSDLTIFQTRLP
jgi:hypothetical protein